MISRMVGIGGKRLPVPGRMIFVVVYLIIFDAIFVVFVSPKNFRTLVHVAQLTRESKNYEIIILIEVITIIVWCR